MEAVTKEDFDYWLAHPVTKRLFLVLRKEKEEMKEGLVYDAFEHPNEVKGRCKAIDQFTNVSYGDLYDAK